MNINILPMNNNECLDLEQVLSEVIFYRFIFDAQIIASAQIFQLRNCGYHFVPLKKSACDSGYKQLPW